MKSHENRIITLSGVSKVYSGKSNSFTALAGIDLTIVKGEFVSIVGRSGSGKSTLLNMIAGIDTPTEGEIFTLGTPIHALSEGRRAQFRGRHMGIVFQFFQLMPTISVMDNIMLPMDFCNYLVPKERKKRALELLDMVGIKDQAKKYPSELSGGQQQRVAIARSMANNPEIIVADEPTGNLDSESADTVYSLLGDLSSKGVTVVMVTHENRKLDFLDRVVTIEDGSLVETGSPVQEGIYA